MLLHPVDGIVEAWIFKMEPLTKTRGAITWKRCRREFGYSIVTQKAEIIMTVIR